MSYRTYLLLGGGGMIGYQIANRICRHLEPEKLIIASLYQEEVREAISALKKDYPGVEFVGFWGDLFIRSEFNTGSRQERLRRGDLLADPQHRAALYEDLYGDPQAAYERSQLVQLILKHRPEVIIDGINTATAISYQDIYSASKIAHRDLEAFLQALDSPPGADGNGTPAGAETLFREQTRGSIETLMISAYIPQLVRHVILINQAMREAETKLYLKIGTTGTGGMGLNIPYTHGEDRPSAKLMSKTAVAFAHTGLLFLMARTQGGPIIKELKPAALVGWLDITYRAIHYAGRPAYIYAAKAEPLGEKLILRQSDSRFERKGKLKMAVADTGENGVFAKGEFETITALRQMEFITPEEIARAAVLEIQGINTGKDVIPALDSAVMGPTYRAGYLRRQAIDSLNELEAEKGTPSVALGQLGPPEIAKLLWEAYLLKEIYGTLERALERTDDEIDQHRGGITFPGDRDRSPEEMSAAAAEYLAARPAVRDLIISTGVPILLPDGQTLLRGPFIRIPEIAERRETPIQPGDIDRWANKGWVDLRPGNLARWRTWFETMRRAEQRVHGKGSAAVDREAYLFEKILIGEVVGWIFNNEMGGYRIK